MRKRLRTCGAAAAQGEPVSPAPGTSWSTSSAISTARSRSRLGHALPVAGAFNYLSSTLDELLD